MKRTSCSIILACGLALSCTSKKKRNRSEVPSAQLMSCAANEKPITDLQVCIFINYETQLCTTSFQKGDGLWMSTNPFTGKIKSIAIAASATCRDNQNPMRSLNFCVANGKRKSCTGQSDVGSLQEIDVSENAATGFDNLQLLVSPQGRSRGAPIYEIEFCVQGESKSKRVCTGPVRANAGTASSPVTEGDKVDSIADLTFGFREPE